MDKDKELQKKLMAFAKQFDWKGLAAAFQKGDTEWHAKEWNELFDRIRKEERARCWKIIKEASEQVHGGGNGRRILIQLESEIKGTNNNDKTNNSSNSAVKVSKQRNALPIRKGHKRQ